jgi:hypothetical protein
MKQFVNDATHSVAIGNNISNIYKYVLYDSDLVKDCDISGNLFSP